MNLKTGAYIEGVEHLKQLIKDILTTPITDRTVEQIAQVLAEYPQAIMEDNKLIKGDKIEIIEGSLKNYQGNLLCQPSGSKVAIKLHGLKQSLIITVPTVLLKKVA